MRFDRHLTEFAGRPVIEFGLDAGRASPKKYTFRLGIYVETEADGRHPFAVLLDEFLAEHGAGDDRRGPSLFAVSPAAAVPGLVVGFYLTREYETDCGHVVAALTDAAPRLPALRHLFIGDITEHECPLEGIFSADMTPLLKAYPRLESLHVRAGPELALSGPIRHESLRTLVFQSDGLSFGLFDHLWRAEFPSLARLELWLGDPDDGGLQSVDPLRPLLAGDIFPRLRSLGLRHSHITDDIARVLARSPLMDRLTELDLSPGNLTDRGADALLATPAVGRLRRLDLSDNDLTDEMCTALRRCNRRIDLSGQRRPGRRTADADDDDRYDTISE